jgi:hypothetical protein
VERDCKAIQETLVEVAGDLSRLIEADLRHLEACSSCCAEAEAERGLDVILSTAVPPADPAVEARVLASLRPVRLRRRLVAFLPVAASCALATLGVAMVGGVPGGSLIARLSALSSQTWLSLVGAANDWVVALAATSSAARLTVPATVPASAAVLGLIGMALVVAAARRWRPITPWQRTNSKTS